MPCQGSPRFPSGPAALKSAPLQKGRVDEAIVHFQKAVQANSKLASALLR